MNSLSMGLILGTLILSSCGKREIKVVEEDKSAQAAKEKNLQTILAEIQNELQNLKQQQSGNNSLDSSNINRSGNDSVVGNNSNLQHSDCYIFVQAYTKVSNSFLWQQLYTVINGQPQENVEYCGYYKEDLLKLRQNVNDSVNQFLTPFQYMKGEVCRYGTGSFEYSHIEDATNKYNDLLNKCLYNQ